MEELYDIVHWEEQVDTSDYDADYRFVGDLMPDLCIENEFSCSPEHQSSIYKLHSTHA